MASPTPLEIATQQRDAQQNRVLENPGALAQGFASLPGSLYNYATSTSLPDMGRGALSMGKQLGGEFVKAPMNFMADAAFAPWSALRDVSEMRAEARKYRAMGDNETADKMEQYAAVSAIGGLPFAGALVKRGVGALVKRGVGAVAKKALPLAVKPAEVAAERAPLAVKPLAMDETSRMARAAAQGFDRDAYHGTHSVFDAIDPNMVDLGVHVGTPEQAANRLKTLSKDKADRGGWTGANTLPLKVNLGKTLDLPDVGQWNDSHVVAKALREKGFDVGDIADEAGDIKRSYEDGHEWRTGPENRSLLDDLRNHLTDKGYGSIRYKNQVENAYGDQAAKLPHVVARQAAIDRELDQIHATVRSRMPKPPDVGDPNVDQVLQRFLDAKPERLMLPEEEARIAALNDEHTGLSSDLNSFGDPYSYVVLDPAKVRSRFAAFDPDKLDSDDLGHAHGGRVSPLAVKRKGKK